MSKFIFGAIQMVLSMSILLLILYIYEDFLIAHPMIGLIVIGLSLVITIIGLAMFVSGSLNKHDANVSGDEQ